MRIAGMIRNDSWNMPVARFSGLWGQFMHNYASGPQGLFLCFVYSHLDQELSYAAD